MATTDVQATVATQDAGEVRLIALSETHVDRNVRQQLLDDEVTALAGSIELLGQITPAIVRADDAAGFVLVAGHKRYAALTKRGRSEIRCEIRAAEAEHAERAAENIVRSALNPYEEAQALAAMLAAGLSETGAAQALG